MNGKQILQRKERKICDYLLKQKNLYNIIKTNQNNWLESFNLTKKLYDQAIKAYGDPYGYHLRDVVLKTTMFLFEMVDEFRDEVEKLNEQTKKDKKIYKDLNKLPFEELKNAEQKALFIIIGHLYENKLN
jgi:hypothetical protein